MTLVRWEIIGDHRKELEQILRNLGLKKRFLQPRFATKGIKLEYEVGDEKYPCSRLVSLLLHRDSKPVTYIEVEVTDAKENSDARKLYDCFSQWAGQLSKNTSVTHCGELDYPILE